MSYLLFCILDLVSSDCKIMPIRCILKYISLDYMYISLMSNEVEYIFLFYCPSCFFFCEMSNMLNVYHIHWVCHLITSSLLFFCTFSQIHFVYIYSLLSLGHIFSLGRFNSVVLFCFSWLSLVALYSMFCYFWWW